MTGKIILVERKYSINVYLFIFVEIINSSKRHKHYKYFLFTYVIVYGQQLVNYGRLYLIGSGVKSVGSQRVISCVSFSYFVNILLGIEQPYIKRKNFVKNIFWQVIGRNLILFSSFISHFFLSFYSIVFSPKVFSFPIFPLSHFHDPRVLEFFGCNLPFTSQ